MWLLYTQVGTNALTNNIITMKYVISITKITEEINGGSDIQLDLSGITEMGDQDLCEKIKDINERLKRHWRFLFIINNMDEKSLNISLLHLGNLIEGFFRKSHNA